MVIMKPLRHSCLSVGFEYPQKHLSFRFDELWLFPSAVLPLALSVIALKGPWHFQDFPWNEPKKKYRALKKARKNLFIFLTVAAHLFANVGRRFPEPSDRLNRCDVPL